MSNKGIYPFISGWAFKKNGRCSGLELLRKEVRSPVNTPDPFIDWWLGAETPTQGYDVPVVILTGGATIF